MSSCFNEMRTMITNIDGSITKLSEDAPLKKEEQLKLAEKLYNDLTTLSHDLKTTLEEWDELRNEGQNKINNYFRALANKELLFNPKKDADNWQRYNEIIAYSIIVRDKEHSMLKEWGVDHVKEKGVEALLGAPAEKVKGAFQKLHDKEDAKPEEKPYWQYLINEFNLLASTQEKIAKAEAVG